jgi:hypothetical protein
MAKGNSISFYTYSLEFADEWISHFKLMVIRLDLKEDFKVGTLLGKGNFAKVHKCERIKDK